ncbi:MAG TPA: hypothetical protein VFG49_17840 [Dyella sp.]|uniref:hypothetical protein n=1 Tax=Dyella sp. TaxID=1869338 RepID=UPI002D7A1A7E|nr:hypothetical protein [Dyella sp.]HET6555394.1 hypothetical protein [Dyella sp.]
MAIKPIPVRLVKPKDGTAAYLSVDVPRDATDIHQHKTGQSLFWSLVFEGKHGSFNTQEDPVSPGFAWIGSHPFPGIFSAPVLFEHGRLMAITDLHDREDKVGTWYYRLSATIDGVAYRTAFEEPYPKRVSLPRLPAVRARSTAPTTDTGHSLAVHATAAVHAITSNPTTTGTGPKGMTGRTTSNPTIKNR